MLAELDEIERQTVADLGKLHREYLSLVRSFREKFVSPAITAEQVYEKILLQNERGAKDIRTGIEWWDEFVGPLRRGNTYVIAGYPGAGKTTLALNLVWAMAKAGRRVWYYCLELKAEETFEVLAGHIEEKAMLSQGDIVNAYAKIQGTGMRFYDPAGYLEWEQHLDQICKTVRAEEMDVVFIDNLGFLTRTRKNTFEVENVASAKIKALAQELEIPIVLLHHLRKPESDQTEPEPNAHSIKGSGAILADSSDSVILHHPLSGDEENTASRNPVGYLQSGKPRWGTGGRRYVRLEGSKRTYSRAEPSEYPKKQSKEIRKRKHD